MATARVLYMRVYKYVYRLIGAGARRYVSEAKGGCNFFYEYDSPLVCSRGGYDAMGWACSQNFGDSCDIGTNDYGIYR